MKSKIIESKLVHCSEPGCNNTFRWDGYGIKPKRCMFCENKRKLEQAKKKKIEKNKELLSQASFYQKSGRSSFGTGKYPAKKKNGKKRIKTTSKNLDKKLDTAWSKLVKLKAGGKCEVCGKTTQLNSHHIYSRAKKSVRWKTSNGICLCVGHHIGVNFSAHKTPIDFSQWLIEYKGQEFLDKLKIEANYTSHYSEFEKEVILKELLNEIKSIKNNGE